MAFIQNSCGAENGPVLAQTLNTHFLITVEYYCLIVQGYEGGGGTHSLSCCAVHSRMLLNRISDLRRVRPEVGETIADLSLAVETNVLKKVLPVTHLNRHFS